MMQDYQQELIVIRDLLKKNPNGMSVTDISKALKKNKNTIGRYLDILLISGQVDMRTYGMAKVYTLSQRVPLSAMLSYSKDLIMVLDNGSRIIDVNANFLNLLHLSRQDTIGKNITYLQSPEVDVHELLDILTTDMKESENTVTFRVRGKGERIFHQKCVPTVFEDGRKGITLILEDVTDHIIAEREIRESEERFRMMADNIRDGLLIMENRKVKYANNRVAEITGYSLDELMTRSPVSIVAPEYRNTIEKRFADIQVPPPSGSHDDLVWIIRRDGERRCVYSRTTFLQNADTSYIFVILTDITELKSKEAALNESEQRFRMMAENIQDGLIIVENDNIVFTNRRIQEISGYSDDDLIAMGLHETILAVDTYAIAASGIVPPSEMVRIEGIIKNVQANPASSGEFKFWMRRKDNTARFIHGKVTAARHGDITNSYITMSDITDFAEREKNLRERIDALQELLH
jgi:PAS domain S-box-containing protein